MAGQVSEKELGTILMQAMLAAKNLRPQRDRLLQLRRRLEQLSTGADDADKIKELASNLFKVYFIGIEAGARTLATCLELAAKKGARLAINLAFDKTDRSGKAPATGEPPQAAASSTVDLDKARIYLDRACTLASLAVKHIDLAVAVISRFMDPKKVASLSDFTDRVAYISEEGPYPSD